MRLHDPLCVRPTEVEEPVTKALPCTLTASLLSLINRSLAVNVLLLGSIELLKDPFPPMFSAFQVCFLRARSRPPKQARNSPQDSQSAWPSREVPNSRQIQNSRKTAKQVLSGSLFSPVSGYALYLCKKNMIRKGRTWAIAVRRGSYKSLVFFFCPTEFG